MKKVLLFGGRSGYIGSEFKAQLLRQCEVVALAPPHVQVDSYRGFIKDTIEHINPDIVINCAGYTGKPNVDACETQKEACFYGNVTYPKEIAKACAEVGTPFGHVSSGCIYNGYDKVFTEEDAPNFSFESGYCSYYSGTKADGEKAILAANPNSFIWRLRIPFEETANPRNYITKMINYDKILSLPNSLSHKGEFVKMCIETITKEVPYGIYNVVNEGEFNAKELFTLLKKYGVYEGKKKFYADLEEFNKDVVAPRSNCVLSVDKLKSVGIVPRHISDAMEETIENYEN